MTSIDDSPCFIDSCSFSTLIFSMDDAALLTAIDSLAICCSSEIASDLIYWSDC